MKQPPFKSLLRSAVIAAIPLTSQVGCANTETVKNPDPVVPADPCRSSEVERKTIKRTFSTQMEPVPTNLTAEQCIALCKQQFEKREVGSVFGDLVKLEKLEASNCKVENRPYSIALPGGRFPKPSAQIACEVEYTGLHAAYTCPRPVVGRIPNGLHHNNHEAGTPNSIGEYLADMARMETAAIAAFDYLSRELEAYAAPAELVARARAAAVEETRHAQMAGLLSAAHGAEVAEVRVDEFQLRSLFDIAMENAVEGCVNETFAAACGVWQGEHAELEVFREVIAHITDEEMGHAELSWAIHQWIMPQLSQTEQEQIQAAQAAAIDRLVGDFKQEGNPELQRAFGLPTRDDAARLFVQLKESVWSVVSGATVQSSALVMA